MPRTNLCRPKAGTSTDQDLIDILAARLSEELLQEIDLRALSSRVLSAILTKLKQQFIAWLLDPESPKILLTECDALPQQLGEVSE